MYTPILMLHICGAIVGLLSGFMAMMLRKGSGLHGAAGNVFFVSMLSMSGAGAYTAASIKPNNGNIMGGVLTFYLVATGWMAARRRDRKVGIFDFSALVVALAIGAAAVTWGLEAAGSQTGLKGGYPPFLYFFFDFLLSQPGTPFPQMGQRIEPSLCPPCAAHWSDVFLAVSREGA